MPPNTQAPHLTSESVVFFLSDLDHHLLATGSVNLLIHWNDWKKASVLCFANLGPECWGSITVDLLRPVNISVVVHAGTCHPGEHCFRLQKGSLGTVCQGHQTEQVFHPWISTLGTTNQIWRLWQTCLLAHTDQGVVGPQDSCPSSLVWPPRVAWKTFHLIMAFER